MPHSTTHNPVAILLLEDSPSDVYLIRNLLSEAAADTAFAVTHCERLADAIEQLREGSFDLALLDLTLPDSAGIDTVIRVHRHRPDVPILVLTGQNDENLCLQALHEGAQDYLSKHQLQAAWLVRAIRYAIERHRASAALQESEEKYRTLLQAMADGMFVAQDYRFVFANPALPAMLGYSLAEFVGLPFRTVIAPDFLPLWTERFTQRIAGGIEPPKIYEVRLLGKDATRSLWVELRANRVQYQGKPGVLGIIRDITARKRFEELHIRSQRMEALGALASGIAHDFNNVLRAITGNLKLAMNLVAVDHPARQHLREIDKATGRTIGLVKQILGFVSPQAQQYEIMPLQSLVEEVLGLLRASLPATIDIRCEFASNVPDIEADATQIHQILMNLLTNSAHAIGHRTAGLIELNVDALFLTTEFVQAFSELRDGRYVRLIVSDNGCGMDQETLRRIFDPFFTTKAQEQGSGLGLATVYSIMQAHRGIITVYSQPGQGASFRLYFPAAADAAAKNPRNATAAAPAGDGKRVLYVDDDESMQFLTTHFLERRGYQVTGCPDANTALTVFQAKPDGFDLVITDRSMPGMSGFDLARRFLAIRPGIPIIMTSGYLQLEDQQTALDMGIRKLVLKSETWNELQQAIEQIFKA